MHKNPYYRLFLLILFLVAFWFLFDAYKKTVLYSSLAAKKTTEDIEWSVKKYRADKYTLIADYEILGKRNSYEETTPHFHRLKDAEETAEAYEGRSWTVWYNPEKPSLSTLQKNSPVKEWIQTVLLWGLCLYFVVLGIYVAKRTYD